MAHFNLTHDNSRGKTYSASDPTNAHIKGWHSGVQVEARVKGGRDLFYVWMTSGADTQQHVKMLVGVVDAVHLTPVWNSVIDGKMPEGF